MAAAGPSERVRVDGKFFRLGQHKFYVKGVAYGPFALSADKDHFPSTALAKAEDSKLDDQIQDFTGKQRPRAWAALALAGSWADHYGAAAMYLRLNGLLPPTAQKKPEENKK